MQHLTTESMCAFGCNLCEIIRKLSSISLIICIVRVKATTALQAHSTAAACLF